MRRLPVALGERAYEIQIGRGLLARPECWDSLAGRRRVLVTDRHVAALHLPAVLATLGLTEDDCLVVDAGEAVKNWDSAERVLDWMLSKRLARDAVLIALGGGVIGDLAGFCAAIYQRGIDFVQVPTTLLAMVDSSVGGKTGVNHPRGKNLIGAFHQPRAVIADLDSLKTLPRRELSAGAAEVIKYGMLGDAAFFAELEQGGLAALMALDGETPAAVVERCCALKARIVGLDEREAVAGGPRALLNLGHTFGHAVETFAGYGHWLHGEAVGLGLVMAADLSARLGWISRAEAERCTALVAAAGLPLLPPEGMTPADFRRLMAGDKKVAGGQLRLVLLRALGEAVLTADFDDAALSACLQHYCRPA
ncbi:3-dehydroquinate synthase [Stagnimonas aquatica]|uniref:3-dehydroquinate synthase n=1 Tax=Stagnimonas aquatica TaxID=2689987 RepID=A0A3N0VPA7_9GAMM|nr:3-dehydroquinate synthase [Stagnimonas aquatica]